MVYEWGEKIGLRGYDVGFDAYILSYICNVTRLDAKALRRGWDQTVILPARSKPLGSLFRVQYASTGE